MRREQGLRGSIDIIKYKAQKMAEEYLALQDKFKNGGLQLSADMAEYIVQSGQKDKFAQYQRNKELLNKERGR